MTSLEVAITEYRRRDWALVPIPTRQKGPTTRYWQTRDFGPDDFPPDGNVGVILGPRSGELVDVDLDCLEALALADTYLRPTQAQFGRLSKPRSHRLYIAPGALFEAFSHEGETLLELRAEGPKGTDGRPGAHQTVIPPSRHPSGELIEWHGEAIAPAVVDACGLRLRCAWLAIGCLVMRHVSRHAAERPGPNLPRVLWEADHDLGRAAYRWLGEPSPDTPQCDPRPRRQLSRAELDLAEIVHAIPNNCDWDEWNRIGMAIYAASNGSNQGGIVFDDWSAKSPKYNPYNTAERWAHWHRSPPSRIGTGTLVYLAKQHGWAPGQKTGTSR